MIDYRVLWTDTGRRDLDEILDFIAIDSPDNALAVLDRLQRRAEALISQPERGRCVPELQSVDIYQYRDLLGPSEPLGHQTVASSLI